MKRIFVLAAIAASTFASCKADEAPRSVRTPTTSPGASATRPSAVAVSVAPSAEFARELDRRRTAWTRQKPSQEENKMTPERVRRMEMSRLELTSLSQEEAAVSMGLGEDEKAKLRQALIEFRDATLFRLEHPDTERRDARGAYVEPYQNRQRKILGDARYSGFSRLEQQEREKLIAGRRAFRKSALEAADPAPPSD